MSISETLLQRSQSKCELCGNDNKLKQYLVPPKNEEVDKHLVVTCENCLRQIENTDTLEPNHWRCLSESMWSEVPAVQVLVYRMLIQLSDNDWAADLKNMMYLDEAQIEWAEASSVGTIVHKDSNGHILQAGDSVVLIKDLNVKGANFVAKRGTAVRRIRLVHDNENHIEGKVEGQQIVILTQYVKKT